MRLSKRQREVLDALPPEARHELSDRWHHRRYLFVKQADLMDRTADLIAQGGSVTELGEGHGMALALHAEAFRALARDDLVRARELFESGRDYDAEIGARGMRVIEAFERAERE